MKSTWFGDRKRYDFARLVAEADVNQGARRTFPGPAGRTRAQIQ